MRAEPGEDDLAPRNNSRRRFPPVPSITNAPGSTRIAAPCTVKARFAPIQRLLEPAGACRQTRNGHGPDRVRFGPRDRHGPAQPGFGANKVYGLPITSSRSMRGHAHGRPEPDNPAEGIPVIAAKEPPQSRPTIPHIVPLLRRSGLDLHATGRLMACCRNDTVRPDGHDGHADSRPCNPRRSSGGGTERRIRSRLTHVARPTRLPGGALSAACAFPGACIGSPRTRRPTSGYGQ